eukprot:gene3398-3888_t
MRRRTRVSVTSMSSVSVSMPPNSELRDALTSVASNATANAIVQDISDEQLDEQFYKDNEFEFANLVFEGGGNKGMAYVGALEV